MLKIRLQRVGRVHEPSYRLVLTDSKNSTKSGKYIESLGSFDARRGEKAEFKSDRIKEWIGKGAKPTDTVHNLLVSKKIIDGKKINVLPLKKAIVKDVPPEATPAPAPAEVAAPAEEPAPAPAESTPEVVEEATA
ncbi:MAG: ribosomal protein S16 [Parcubacteria bacterium C7867-006]|nr:MAG: ribosomal protein S16 [Parcubacteria bacterium C7867-006]